MYLPVDSLFQRISILLPLCCWHLHMREARTFFSHYISANRSHPRWAQLKECLPPLLLQRENHLLSELALRVSGPIVYIRCELPLTSVYSQWMWHCSYLVIRDSNPSPHAGFEPAKQVDYYSESLHIHGQASMTCPARMAYWLRRFFHVTSPP